MIVQCGQSETSRAKQEVMVVARERQADHAATPGLVRKSCRKLGKPNRAAS